MNVLETEEQPRAAMDGAHEKKNPAAEPAKIARTATVAAAIAAMR